MDLSCNLRPNFPNMIENLACGYDCIITALLQFECAAKLTEDAEAKGNYVLNVLVSALSR